MSHDELIILHRVQLLNYASQHSVTAACHIFGVSRTRYYELKRLYETYGRDGLRPRPKPYPLMPNRIRKDVIADILAYVRLFPTHGPKRIAYELKRATDGRIHYTGASIYNILRRRGLNKRLDRLLYAERHSPGFTDLLVDEVRKEAPHVHTSYPGELISIDSKLVGKIAGIGRIYHQVAVDCDSSFGFAKLSTEKTAASSADFVETCLLPISSALGVPVRRILTDNGTEYTARTERGKAGHLFERTLETAGIRHSTTKVKHPWTNGYAESFHKTLLYEFYHVAFRRKIYTSLRELQDDLNDFLLQYNFKRSHSGYKLKGMTPAEKFLNGRRCPSLAPRRYESEAGG